MTSAIRVALLGCGTVGIEVARALCDPGRADELADAVGAPLELVGVAVADLSKPRPGVRGELLTTDAASLIAAGPDVVVELIGGTTTAAELIDAAIDRGASVVTANKALLAARLGELTRRAAERGVDLLYEASVAGAIPVIGVLRGALAGERLTSVLGIVNGTTNYLLTTMSREGRAYDDVLAEAIELGYAEADPRADVEGHDAAQKAAILASLAFGQEVADADVAREGISRITAADLEAAARMGHVVRLLAVAERSAHGAVSVRVHPAMVPVRHPLAAVDGTTNAVFLEGDDAGALTLVGAGAGGAPTASAVIGDVIAAARNRARGAVERAPRFAGGAGLTAPNDVVSAFYLAVEVADRPGVLAAVATVFGAHGVSIRSMEQIGLHDDARLIFLTHVARETAMSATVAELERLDAVVATGALLHVIEWHGR